MKFNKNFMYLLGGQSISNIGDVLYMVSLISLLYRLSGSAFLASLVPFTITTSMFVSSLLTPLWMRKVNVKHLIVSSQFGKTIMMMALTTGMQLGLLDNHIEVVFLFIVPIAILDGCANPLRQSMVPLYVPQQELVRANGMSESVTQMIHMTLWFIGGILVTLFSSHTILWAVVLLFMVSTILLSFLDPVKHQPNDGGRITDSLLDGWKTIAHIPPLKKLAKMMFLESIADTVWVAAILFVFVELALGTDESWWGYINGSFFVGVMIGSIYCIRHAAFIERNVSTFLYTSTFVSFAFTLIFSVTSIPIIALCLSALIGITGQLEGITQQTIIQRTVPSNRMAAVYSSLGALVTGTFGVSVLIMGAIAEHLGVRAVYLMASALLFIVSIIAYSARSVMTSPPVSQEE
jgi:MFS family permease